MGVDARVGRARCAPVADVDAAAGSSLGPALALELAISGADGVGMNGKAAREFTSAGQAVAGAQITAENCELDLRGELAIERYIAVRRKPETHYSLAESGLCRSSLLDIHTNSGELYSM